MHIKRYLFTVLALSAFVSLASAEQVCTESEYKGRSIKKCYDTGTPSARFTDPRDGQSYRTVKIGNQTWMAENLNYETDDSYCYDNESANCQKYGRLYTWNAAMEACPSGWHLPSYDEWKPLFSTVGGENAAGTALKSTSDWNYNGNGTDAYGFSALPVGYRDNNGYYGNVGYFAYFWSSTADDSGNAYYWFFSPVIGDVISNYNSKYCGFSVRCLRNSKDIDKVLKDVVGLQTTDKTVLVGRRGKADGGFNEGQGYAEGGSGDGLGSLLGGGGGGIATKARGTIKTPSARDIDMGAGGGSRSAADIMKVVRQRTPGLRHIYNKYLKKQPGFAGKVTLRFTIAPGGDIISISIASSTTGFGEFDNAVKNAVKRWTFSKVKSGNTTVTIPFTFSE